MHETYETDIDDYQYTERLNKSQQKREIKALLELGKQLALLDSTALHKMDMPPELLQAILDVQSMKHGAEKRQYKLICKMLRQINTDSLEETIETLSAQQEQLNRAFHQTEYWRDRLISDGIDAMTEFMQTYPHADAGQIRQLLRNANKEMQQNKPPRASRQLFRLLRQSIEQ